VVEKEEILGQIISYSAFWANIVKQAETLDFRATEELQMSKKQMIELISKIYSEKLLADEVDDRARQPRQSLPEFLYDYHLELLSEPQLAEAALVNLVANVRVYDRTSVRIRMFSRFLNLGGQPYPLEALSIFLLSLVRVQNGQLPLLAEAEGFNVEAARGLKVIEHVFAQAPHVIRQKVLLEADKRSTGKTIDIDSLLLFIIEQWRDESGRAEERLRALFVASDTDGDGNLDYGEFTSMINHISTGKGHRECLRMYAEMTLNKTVDCNTFVRVCRKHRFFTFEPGPANKKSEKGPPEVFDMLLLEWKKIEDVVHEVLVVLQGTPVGKRLEQHVVILKKLLNERVETEQCWLTYRSVVAEFTSAIRNRNKPG